jgi:hypothetical protein
LRIETLGLSRESAKVAVIDGIQREFMSMPFSPIQPSWVEAGLIIEEKYRSREWNQRR